MAHFGRPLVVNGPSGVGKSTILGRLLTEFPDRFGFSVSHTTRSPRPGETHGKEYFFVTQEKFKELIDENAFLEYAHYSGNYYGTSFMTVRQVQEQGKRCILDIEAQGVRQVKATNLNPIYVFVSPPSMSELRSRLLGRGTETDASVQKRLAAAQKEVEYARSGAHDLVVVNDNLERAYNLFQKIALGDNVDSDHLPGLDE